MIRLHPIPDADHTCPGCKVKLKARGWYIPGMRMLADLECPQCGNRFYGDLPAGHGLMSPMLVDQANGTVYDDYRVSWFATWLSHSYANRVSSPVEFKVETFGSLQRPLLLNCLDTLYGHCLLKLINAQYYLDHHPDFDLIVLVPPFLRWLVPKGAACIVTANLKGTEWNDWLAAELKRYLEPFHECWLGAALSHPHPRDYQIERFTGIHPFPIEEWDQRLERPMITFIWREDRLWCGPGQKLLRQGQLQKWVTKVKRKLDWDKNPLEEQKQQVLDLAQALRQFFPNLDFAVVGLGQFGKFPDWMTDLRTAQMSEALERIWCQRYAHSHLVVGVHGSNMLLPSAHAGAVVELVPSDRWSNLIQDLLIPMQDPRETLFRYRLLPLETTPTKLAEVIHSLLQNFAYALLNYGSPGCDHQTITSNPHDVAQKYYEVRLQKLSRINRQ